MKILNDIILNIVLLLFPILLYFIYNCYREIKCEKYNDILFDLSIFTSLYFVIKYDQATTPLQILTFTTITILIAYLSCRKNTAIILSLITSLYIYYTYPQYLLNTIIKLIILLFIYKLGRNRNIKDNSFILIASIIQAFFTSIDYFFLTPTNTLLTFLDIFLSLLIFYLLPLLLLYLFNLANNITSLYQTITKFEKEKQLKNSLFKITHEVKNPIAVCKGYLDMTDINNHEKLEKYIPIIKQEIDRSLNIMSDFMEFSKIKIDKEILDINILLEDIIEELHLLTVNKNIELVSHIPKDEVFITGDYNRLKQVFINLIKNSIESITNKGKINVITHSLKDKYYIEIIDNGCGMDEYTLSKVKDLFFTTKKKGSGLGVSLSNEIIKAHNGEIIYESKEKRGTKVIVKIPTTML